MQYSSDNVLRILVLAPIGNDAALTVRILQDAGIPAAPLLDMDTLCVEIGHGCGAVMIAEEALGREPLQKMVAILRTQPSWSDIPIILVTTRGESSQSTLQNLTVFGPAGIVSLLERPFRPITAINAAQVALRSRRRQYQVRDLLIERDTLLADLEQRVALRTSELRDINAQLEELIYTIAHDLRAPLRSIHGYSSMLLEDESLPAETRSLAERLSRAAVLMDRLTLDLLQYGRIARAEVDPEAVSLQEACDSALALCEGAIRESGATIQVRGPLPSVRGSLSILTHVIANLIGNAIKFVKDGEAPSIEIGAEFSSETARLWVRDHGIGIPAEHHERIFRVFERLEDRRFKGTGIGLSIVRKGIERLGGQTGVHSELGKGACFWFELPLSK